MYHVLLAGRGLPSLV